MKQFIQYQIKSLLVGLGVSAAFTICIAAMTIGLNALNESKPERQHMTLAEYYESEGIDNAGIND